MFSMKKREIVEILVDFKKDNLTPSEATEAILNIFGVINWVACSDKLPELHKPVLILTDYGKSDVCRLNIDDNRLLWINDMRPQHTNGSVIAWAELPKPPCL